MAFTNVFGHELQKKILINSMNENRIGHSYIFSARDGIGKKLLAIEFSKILNCKNPADNINTECECVSCSKIAKSIHPDVLVYEFEDEKNIKVDHVRQDIEPKIYLSPFEGNYKVFIVDGAERMNVNAQNAFLKTLEEPPKFSIIILITSSPDQILPTIKSRCQIINFNPLPDKIIKEKLNEENMLGPEEIDMVLNISGGSLKNALEISGKVLAERKEILKKIIEYKLSKRPLFSDLTQVLKFENKKMEIDQVKDTLEIFSIWFRDLLRLKANAETKDLKYPFLFEESIEFLSGTSFDQLLENIKLLEETWLGISTYNTNKKLAMETFLMKTTGQI